MTTLPTADHSTRHILALIMLATVLRLVFAQTGYGIDEIYAVATSRDYHLSGFDHPPMAWWLSTTMQKLFGVTTPWVVRLPFIALAALDTWLIYALTRGLFSARAGFLAALAFTCAPVLGVTSGTWVLPDGPLNTALLAGMLTLAQVFFAERTKPQLWVLAGFFGGLAMLSKYHGVFFFAGTFLFLLTHRRYWFWFRSIWPYLGVAVGLAVFSPVVLWNMQHDWVSFAFQGARSGEVAFHPFKPLLVVLGQAGFLAPWVWLPLVLSILAGWRARMADDTGALLLCLGLPIVIFFTLISAISSSPMLFHWAMPGYLLLFPLLGDWLAQRRWVARWAKATAAVTVLLLAVVMCFWYAPQTTHQLGIPADPLADMRPYTEIHDYLDVNLDGDKLNDDKGLVIAPTKWHSAGQFDVALAGRYPVTCFDADARAYGILAPLSGFAGRDFLIPVALKRAKASEAELAPHFAKLTRLPDFTVHQGGDTETVYAMFLGKALKDNAVLR